MHMLLWLLISAFGFGIVASLPLSLDVSKEKDFNQDMELKLQSGGGNHDTVQNVITGEATDTNTKDPTFSEEKNVNESKEPYIVLICAALAKWFDSHPCLEDLCAEFKSQALSLPRMQVIVEKLVRVFK